MTHWLGTLRPRLAESIRRLGGYLPRRVRGQPDRKFRRCKGTECCLSGMDRDLDGRDRSMAGLLRTKDRSSWDRTEQENCRNELDIEYSMMLYNKREGEAAEAKTGAGSRAQEESHCSQAKGRGAFGPRSTGGSGKPLGCLLRSGRDQACDRETYGTITRMERDRKRLQPQPAPNQAFLPRGTHG